MTKGEIMTTNINTKIEALENTINNLKCTTDEKNELNEKLTDLKHFLKTKVVLFEPEKEDTLDMVKNSIEQFEEEHPDLTAMLNRVMDAFSKIGI